MSTQNITLSIPNDILAKLKVIAAKQGMSISELLTRALEEIVTREEGYQAAHQRHLSLLEEDNLSLGTDGIIPWTRTELHER
jgi:hypothetical protein